MGHRTAGVTIYLQEELSDARLRLDELKGYIVRALNLVNGSEHKDILYALAGDIIHAVPETLLKVERAVQATAMALNKFDYEELRQIIRPDKVDELERVLDEVRMQIPRRTGALTETDSCHEPEGMAQTASLDDLDALIEDLARAGSQ